MIVPCKPPLLDNIKCRTHWMKITNYKICVLCFVTDLCLVHPTYMSTRFLPINQTEAIDSSSEKERTTEEGKRNQSISQRCFNNSRYTLALFNEQINNATFLTDLWDDKIG